MVAAVSTVLTRCSWVTPENCWLEDDPVLLGLVVFLGVNSLLVSGVERVANLLGFDPQVTAR